MTIQPGDSGDDELQIVHCTESNKAADFLSYDVYNVEPKVIALFVSNAPE